MALIEFKKTKHGLEMVIITPDTVGEYYIENHSIDRLAENLKFMKDNKQGVIESVVEIHALYSIKEHEEMVKKYGMLKKVIPNE